jgi:predicted anti-sigma-YlaC factor YlaD
MLSCKETSLLASQSLDRRLSWRERIVLRLHLLFCDACRTFANQVAFLRAAARRFGRGANAPEPLRLSQDARERIAGKLRDKRA